MSRRNPVCYVGSMLLNCQRHYRSQPTHGIGRYRHLLLPEVPKRRRERMQMKEIDPGTEHKYGVLNIVMTGYDMTLVEHYAQYIHRLCNRLSVKVEESLSKRSVNTLNEFGAGDSAGPVPGEPIPGLRLPSEAYGSAGISICQDPLALEPKKTSSKEEEEDPVMVPRNIDGDNTPKGQSWPLSKMTPCPRVAPGLGKPMPVIEPQLWALGYWPRNLRSSSDNEPVPKLGSGKVPVGQPKAFHLFGLFERRRRQRQGLHTHSIQIGARRRSKKSYAMPTKTMEVMLAQELGAKMHLDAVLTTHQRVVQISSLSATFAPILLEIIQNNQPEGLHLLVKEHTETDFKIRLKARPELEGLLSRMS